MVVSVFDKFQRTSLQYPALTKTYANKTYAAKTYANKTYAAKTYATKTYASKTLIIVYNRVPKCGSTFMLRLFGNLSRKHRKFVHEHSRNYDDHWLSTEDRVQLTQSLKTLVYDFPGRPVLYDRHFRFFYMAPTSKVVFKFINMIRDPLKQVLSAFDYKRYHYFAKPSGRSRRKFTSSVANLTMDDCIKSNNSANCLRPGYAGVSMISYFCGLSPICGRKPTRFASHAAASLAKSNIERFYTWVGVLEYLESSLELLEYQLPSIFFGITKLYRTTLKGKRANVTPDTYRHTITNSTRAILLRLLATEYDFYEFVRKRFMDNYRRVFKEKALPTT